MARCVGVTGWWRQMVVLLTPLIFSFMVIAFTSSEARCGYVILVMAVYWMTEAVPLAATALIPIFAFPLLGVLSTGTVCLVYLKDTNVMFMGGLIMAVAVEHCNLHKRIALVVILFIGQSPRRLMAGFMVTTTFLSMWISNTAAAAMIVPIVDAVVKELVKTRAVESQRMSHKLAETGRNTILEDAAVTLPNQSRLKLCDSDATFSDIIINPRDSAESTPRVERREKVSKAPNFPTLTTLAGDDEDSKNVRKMFFLAVAFAANIGGTGSPLGCGPNLVLMGLLQSTFSEPTGLNFATWMLFNLPGMLLCGFIGWSWLQILYMGCCRGGIQKSSSENERLMKEFLQGEYSKLGRITQHELVVLITFTFLVFLWVFRDPGFIPGWGHLFPTIDGKPIVRDATPVMFVVFLLFVIPSKSPCDRCLNPDAEEQVSDTHATCLTWEVVQSKVPWGVILLLGGGFAMAEAARESGLSAFLGLQLQYFNVMPKELIVLVVCFMTAMLTEVASNTATASVLLPVIKDLSLGINANPLYLMLPATLCCAYAFMLPVATPGNAIILTVARMSTHEMMRAGIVMNIMCVLIVNLMINTLGILMFDIHEMPSWTNSTTSTLL